MFGDKKLEFEKHLIEKGYKDVKFLEKNGDAYFFSVRTTWKGKHTVKVSGGFFGRPIIE